MILLANGCSFTEGYDLDDPMKSWPFQLASKLNYNVVNLALGGASNDRIFRTTIEYLNTHNKPDLIVIGWTGFNRAELSSADGMYLRLTNNRCLPDTLELDKDLTNIHKFWFVNLHNEYISYRNWIHYILHLQMYFDHANIKYRFFSAFDNYINEFLTESDLALELADHSYQWRDRNKYAPFRDIHQEYQELVSLTKRINLSNWILSNRYTMQSYLKQEKFTTDSTGHFLADGHAAWAERIGQDL